MNLYFTLARARHKNQINMNRVGVGGGSATNKKGAAVVSQNEKINSNLIGMNIKNTLFFSIQIFIWILNHFHTAISRVPFIRLFVYMYIDDIREP